MTAQLTPLIPSQSSLQGRTPGSDVAINPFWGPLAMVVTQDLALPLFFRQLTVLGAEYLPLEGPLLLAPTHRSRWDALLLPYAAGRRRTGRDCRFMVTVDEMVGLQGWFLQRLGCFPVNPRRPGPSSLRLAVELLQAHQQLVVFPEGRIQQDDEPLRLMPGLARLAQLALTQGLPVKVLPVGIAYGHRRPQFCDRAALCFGPPQPLEGEGRRALATFTHQLSAAMQSAEEAARRAVGRPLEAT
jgi:1-acyl-sn-glycerol-3-phosphate acyltransferase